MLRPASQRLVSSPSHDHDALGVLAVLQSGVALKVRSAVPVLLGGVTAAAIGYTGTALADRPSPTAPAGDVAATVIAEQRSAPAASTVAAELDSSVAALLPEGDVLPAIPLHAPATFEANLAAAKAIVKTDIGEHCDEGDPTFLLDPTSPQPVLVAVSETTDGGRCEVVGWSYRDGAQNHDLNFTLPVTNTGYTLQPLFDSAGNVISFGQPGPDIQYPNGPDEPPVIVDTAVDIVQPVRLLGANP